MAPAKKAPARGRPRKIAAKNTRKQIVVDTLPKLRAPTGHLSSSQRQCLGELYLEFPQINGPVIAHPEVLEVWKTCLIELNKLPGSRKTLDQWRRALKDLLYRRKKKSEKMALCYAAQRKLHQDVVVFSLPKWVQVPGSPDPDSVLIHETDPYISDTTSYSDTETEIYSDLFSDDEDSNNVSSLTAAVDEFCLEAESVTPRSYLEEVVSYLKPDEIIEIPGLAGQNYIEEQSSSKRFSLKRKISGTEKEKEALNVYFP